MIYTLLIGGKRTHSPSPLVGEGGEGGAGGAFSGKNTAVIPTPGPAPQGGGESEFRHV